MKKVAVIMGSDSDLPVVAPAIKQLRELSIETEVHVMSAHRTPKEAMAFAESARENGFGVILAAAGMAVCWPLPLLCRGLAFRAVPRCWTVWTPCWLR